MLVFLLSGMIFRVVNFVAAVSISATEYSAVHSEKNQRERIIA